MTIAWFLVPYVRRISAPTPTRYVAIDDFTNQIFNIDGGGWAETEVLGNMAVVKVNASDATLAQLAALYFQIPANALDLKLSSLTANQKTALQSQVLALGYTSAEITTALGANLGQRTLREVLHFIASKRQEVRYNKATDSFVFDGPIVTPESIESVDAQVQ